MEMIIEVKCNGIARYSNGREKQKQTTTKKGQTETTLKQKAQSHLSKAAVYFLFFAFQFS